ncbi:MAG: hypothetical protein LBJ32_01710, partial [Oscillospiraceae bacterium]|nr:hypothetical protein [Oscillospiraceae bacterium]
KAEKEINQVSLKTGEKNKTSFLKVLATGLAIFLAIPMTQDLCAVNPETGEITDRHFNAQKSIMERDLTVPSLFLIITLLGLGNIYQYSIWKNNIPQTKFYINHFDDFKTINEKFESIFECIDICNIPKALEGPNPGMCQAEELQNLIHLDNNQIAFFKRILEVIAMLFVNSAEIRIIFKEPMIKSKNIDVFYANLSKFVKIVVQLDNILGNLSGTHSLKKNAIFTNEMIRLNSRLRNFDEAYSLAFSTDEPVESIPKCQVFSEIHSYLIGLWERSEKVLDFNSESAKFFFEQFCWQVY